ncbi:MAG: TIGR00730 family Rossman fold protein [Gammaproteobacteria bacterium]|nr:TIGR00730 family Rossman fold protein [Gammaproteobacteria bacterium]
MKRRRVCVLCGAAAGAAPGFSAAAAALGELLARQGHEVVYGGSSSGCMGALADAALAVGGHVTGIVPRQLISNERPHQRLTDLEITADLASRKLRMFARSDAIIALPGGTGTLDELLEALTMKRLDYLEHPIAVVNVLHFYDPFITLLAQCIDAGFADRTQRGLFDVLAEVPAVRAWLLQ